MKKTLLILLITFGIFEVHAQTNVFPSKGSVGIGTTSPLATLHIKNIPDVVFQVRNNVEAMIFPLGVYGNKYTL